MLFRNFLFIFCTSLSLFSKNVQNEKMEAFLLSHLHAAYEIITKAPDVIREYTEEKLYLDEGYTHTLNQE